MKTKEISRVDCVDSKLGRGKRRMRQGLVWPGAR